jgi:hypothetical protein
MSSNSKLIFDSYRILTSASTHHQQCWLCNETIFRILNAHYPSLKKTFNFTADVALPTAADAAAAAAAAPPPSCRRRRAGFRQRRRRAVALPTAADAGTAASQPPSCRRRRAVALPPRPQPPRCCHRAATKALCASAAPPLARCRHGRPRAADRS